MTRVAGQGRSSEDVMSEESPTRDLPEEPAAHIVSPAQRKRLQQCYEHGTRLLQQEKYDYDYAHSLLVQCATGDPGNLIYIEALLANLQRKFGNRKRGARLKAFAARGGFSRAVRRQDWEQVLKLGPDLLRHDPWDATVLRGLAEACAAHGYHDVELRYLKNALDAHPRDAAINRHCALSLARVGQFDQAITCWQRVDEIRRGDREAQEMISELQIEKTRQMTEGPRRPSKSARPAKVTEPTPEPEVTPAEPERREVKLTPRQQLEQRIAGNPADLEAYQELAELHVQADRLGEAAHVLRRALDASGNDVTIRERLEDVEILRKKQQLAVAQQKLDKERSAEAEQLVENLRDELRRFEWEVFYARSERYPEDGELQYELGKRLKEFARHREAAKCFHQACRNEARRADAALELGECYQQLKQYDEALKCYRRAIEWAGDEDAETLQRALYRAGVLAAALQNLEAAENDFARLVQMAPDYRDAAARLDKVRRIRHK